MTRVRAFFGKHNKKYIPRRIIARIPVLLDPKLPSIAELPDEVVLLILSFVDMVTLRRTASLSSYLYEKSQRVQHHITSINLDEGRQALARIDVLTSNLLLPAVHDLTIRGDSITEEEEEDIWVHLADAVSNMTGLRDMHWQCPLPIPRSLLQRIPSRTRLHTNITATRPRDQDQEQSRNFLARLYDNQNLFSLSVHIAFNDEQKCRLTMQALKQVLLTCPQLVRIPQLYVGPPQLPLYGIGDGPLPGALYCGIGFCGGEKIPALEEFGVRSFFCYPWGREQTPILGANSIYSIGYPEKGTEVQYWAKNFDWSRLRKLSDIPDDLAFGIATNLTCLKEVIFEDEYWDKATFLELIPTALETLSVPTWGHVSNDPGPIVRHGAALRHLTIHRTKSKQSADNFVGDSDLVALRDGLPHLVNLTLDIARDPEGNAWPYSSLDIIAKFPNLRSIQLWFELGDGSVASPTPHLTVAEARGLFRYLHERSSSILSLTLRTGALGKIGIYKKPNWVWQNSVHLVCKISINEGEASEGFITVNCPDLSTEMNAELKLLSQDRGTVRGLANSSLELSLEVAVGGPFTMDEWNKWRKLQDTRSVLNSISCILIRPTPVV